MEYNASKFQSLISKCIGQGSQTEFAAKCGLSREHVSRMLSSSSPVRPSKSTLKKIASAFQNAVTYDELLISCGYIESEEEARKTLPLDQRSALCVQELRDGLKAMTKGCRVFPSIKEMLQEFEMLYSADDFTDISMSRPEEYEGNDHPGAEKYVIVRARIEDRLQYCNIWFVVYFAETKGGNLVILDTAMDGASLIEAGIFEKDKKRLERVSPDEIKQNEYVYFVDIKGEMAEKLLNAIFGKNEIKYVTAKLGFGFYLDKIPTNLRQFVVKHKKTLTSDNILSEYYDIALENDNIEDSFLEYYDDITYEDGYEAMVAKVMKLETGMNFSLFRDETDKPRSCIMIPDVVDGTGEYTGKMPIEKLKKAVSSYAKELGVKEYGAVFVNITGSIWKEDNVFAVKGGK